jgi:hypothetical protein
MKKDKIYIRDNIFLEIDESLLVDQAGESSKMSQEASPSSSACIGIIRFWGRKIKGFVEESDRCCNI